VRSAAASALGEMGESAKSSVPSLIPLLKDPDINVRSSTAWALSKMGKAAIPAIPALITALKEDPLEGGASIVHALSEIGAPAVTAMVTALKDPNSIVRWRAADGLGSMREDVTLKFKDQVVPALTTALKDPDADVRSSTAWALGQMKEVATPAVPGLAMALKDPDVRVQLSAAWTLAVMEEAIAPTVLAMIAILKADPKDEMRSRAEEILSQIGEPAIPAIVTALKTPDVRVRLSALSALGSMGGEATLEIPITISAFSDPELSRLTRATKDPNGREVPTLIKMLEAQAVPSLITVLRKDPDSLVRSQALWALGKMRKSATSAIPAMITALKDPEKRVRLNAAWALGRMETAAIAAVPALITVLKRDSDSFVQSYTAWALGQMGKAATSAIPTLITSLKKDSGEQVRMGARNALIKIGEPAVTEIIAALRDPDALVRSNAADILGWIREDANDKFNFPVESPERDSREQMIANIEFRNLEKSTNAAIPELIRLLEDKDARVQLSATKALEQLGYRP
jgi:HEAT repeat protein